MYGHPNSFTYALTISQTIDLETDKGKNCKDYPNEFFSSYRECDENFVYNEVVKNYPMMPFWAARNIDEISQIAYYNYYIHENYDIAIAMHKRVLYAH